MRPLILLTILLASAICSCRSQQHIAEQSTETTSVAIDQHTEASSVDELIAAIKSDSDLTISDITITFFQPDSAHPDARTAPASLSIGSVRARTNVETALGHKSESVESEYENITAGSESKQATNADKEVNALSPPTSTLTILLIALIVIAFIAYTVYRIRATTV